MDKYCTVPTQGSFTDFNVWDSLLSNQEMEEFSLCRSNLQNGRTFYQVILHREYTLQILSWMTMNFHYRCHVEIVRIVSVFSHTNFSFKTDFDIGGNCNSCNSKVQHCWKPVALGWQWLEDELRDWPEWIPSIFYQSIILILFLNVAKTIKWHSIFYSYETTKIHTPYLVEVLEMDFNEICSQPGKLALFPEKITFPEAAQVKQD